MSWLADRVIKHIYEGKEGRTTTVEFPAMQAAPGFYEDSETGETMRHIGFEPDEVRQTQTVEYEQHGRKAVQVREKDGSIRHISKSKLHYLKTGKVKNFYTTAFEEKLKKQEDDAKARNLLTEQENKRRAVVTDVRLKDLVKEMPDGEYVSDGHTVQRIK